MIPLSDPLLHRRTTPYVTIALLVLNGLVFLYTLVLSDIDGFILTYRLGVIPAELTQGLELGVERFRLGPRVVELDLTSPVPTAATMFTSMFLHGGWFHLGSNMLYLWVFGDNVEDRLGHTRYLLFYLGTGVAAVWAQVLVDPASEVPMIGASGAIAGVLGAYLVLYPQSRVNTLIMLGFLITTVRISALLLLGFWFVLQAFSGLGQLAPSSAGSGVAYAAHAGGFVAGAGIIFAYRLFRREPLWQSGSYPYRPRRRPY